MQGNSVQREVKYRTDWCPLMQNSPLF